VRSPLGRHLLALNRWLALLLLSPEGNAFIPYPSAGLSGCLGNRALLAMASARPPSGRPDSGRPGATRLSSALSGGEFKGYGLTAVAAYALRARVLHTKRYWIDGNDLVPYDVALGWGRIEMTKPE
jgi:hypothetical protein